MRVHTHTRTHAHILTKPKKCYHFLFMFFILIAYEVGAKLGICERAQVTFTNSPKQFLSFFYVYFLCGMAFSIVNNRYHFFLHSFTHGFSLILSHTRYACLFVQWKFLAFDEKKFVFTNTVSLKQWNMDCFSIGAHRKFRFAKVK